MPYKHWPAQVIQMSIVTWKPCLRFAVRILPQTFFSTLFRLFWCCVCASTLKCLLDMHLIITVINEIIIFKTHNVYLHDCPGWGWWHWGCCGGSPRWHQHFWASIPSQVSWRMTHSWLLFSAPSCSLFQAAGPGSRQPIPPASVELCQLIVSWQSLIKTFAYFGAIHLWVLWTIKHYSKQSYLSFIDYYLQK